MRIQALFYVTYRWFSVGHPDPDGFYLARLVDVLTNEKADDDDGVFFDWSSLYQKPRSELQEKLFEEGLQASHHVRFNFRVGCIVLFDTPEGYHGTQYWQPHVYSVPTNCQFEGPVRQRTHGSRVARGMERAAVQ